MQSDKDHDAALALELEQLDALCGWLNVYGECPLSRKELRGVRSLAPPGEDRG